VVGKISFHNTYIFECGTNDAQVIEDFCHKYFKEFNTNPYDDGDGYSEWYDFSIFKAVKKKVLKHTRLFEITSHCTYFDKFKTLSKRKPRPNKKLVSKPVCKIQNEISHPFAFKKLPEHIQQSKPMDYRYVDYDYASKKCEEYGITSARQYRAFQQAFNPQGFPSNPDRTYESQWQTWDSFLQCETKQAYCGTNNSSVKHDELMPYNDALIWTRTQKFSSTKAYMAAWDNDKVPYGIPRQPQARYSEFYTPIDGMKTGWKYFLGKDTKITATFRDGKSLITY